METEFEPECLVISLGDACSQRCLYCYSRGRYTGTAMSPPLFLKSVEAAAELVAAVCRRKQLPFACGFQGGGEPLCHFELLEQTQALLEKTAARYRLRMSNFITSNGTALPAQYRWLAKHFRRICLSVDGRPAVHNALRSGSFDQVRLALDECRQQGRLPVCRMTATHLHGPGLYEDICYLIDELGFEHIQVEPAYGIGRESDLPPDAEIFAEGCYRAGQYGRRKGVVVAYSGYRPGEKHGPYCRTEKQVLFVNPAGAASACLFHEPDSSVSRYWIGSFCLTVNRFLLDQNRIADIKEKIQHPPAACRDCALVDHCTRGCPDICLLTDDSGAPGSLRCRINKKLHELEKQ